MVSRTHLGVGLGSFAFVVFVVGFATPYWVYGTANGYTTYQGLWRLCVKGIGCENIVGSVIPFKDWFKAVQALECLAFIAGLAGLGLSILPLVKSDLGQRSTLLKGAMGAYIAAGVIGILGAIIFGVKQEKHLHFAYALTIIGAVFFGFAGALLGSAPSEDT